MRLSSRRARLHVISDNDVGKRLAPTTKEVREVDPLVLRLVGQILAKLRGGETREGLAGEAKRHVQTLYGWLNGRRRSPSLLVFNDYVQAAGLNIILSDSTGIPVPCGRSHVDTDVEKDILGWVRALSEEGDRKELRRLVRDFVLAHTSGSRPPDPTEGK